MSGDVNLKALWRQLHGTDLPEGGDSPFNGCMYRAGCRQTQASYAALLADREADEALMRQALEAFQRWTWVDTPMDHANAAISALRARLGESKT